MTCASPRISAPTSPGCSTSTRTAERRKVGIAGYRYFPAPVYLSLRDAVPDATISDASDLTAILRMRKSPAELDLMRAASEISDRAMAAGLAQINDGAAEVDVAAAAEAVIRSAGAEPSFVTEMGSGPRTALGTFLPGGRTLSRGEFAVLDCGARVHGYHGDMCRTVVVGGANAEQANKLRAVEAAVGRAIAAIKPGATVGDIRDEAANAIADAGYGEQLVGRVHAARKRRRAARTAKRQGTPRPGAPGGHGALHRARHHRCRRGSRHHRADDRRGRRRRRSPEQAPDEHVGADVKLRVELPTKASAPRRPSTTKQLRPSARPSTTRSPNPSTPTPRTRASTATKSSASCRRSRRPRRSRTAPCARRSAS